MKKTLKTRDIVFAALLTALSILITYSPLKMPLPQPFTVTIASHVPTMIAMFINPWVTILTAIGSCAGFLMVFPAPMNVIVMLRAAMHIIFGLLGIWMMNKKNINIFIVIVVTSLVHAGLEAIVVWGLTPFLTPGKITSESPIQFITWTTFIGTLFHHYLDCAITAPILYALTKAKLIRTPSINWSRFKKNNSIEA